MEEQAGLHLRIPRDLRERFAREAALRALNRSEWVRQRIEEQVERWEAERPEVQA